VMTARGDVETAVQAMKAGADGFIEKPFDDELLLGAINAALARVRRPTLGEEMEAAKRVARLSLRENAKCLTGSSPAARPSRSRTISASARAVEAHRSRMLVRLGTHSPAEAVRLAVMVELAPADPAAPATPRQPDDGVSRELPK
jgi:two-component system, LuxR family, response regulator FixJ